MRILEESSWITSFSKDLYQTYFSFISANQWTTERLGEWEWFLGVKNPCRDQLSYQYHLHIDPRHLMITIRLHQKQPASLHLFGTVYHHLVHYLTHNKIDCLVHTDERYMWTKLYKKNQLPLTPTSVMSCEIVQLLTYIQGILGKVHLHPYDTWDGGAAIYLSAKSIQYQWRVRFCFDESEKKARGYIEIDGTYLYDHADVQKYLNEEARCLLLLQKEETRFLTFVQEVNKDGFYDPLAQSLVLFQKHVPFQIQCLKEQKEQSYEFVIRIGSHHQKSKDIYQLVDVAKAYIEQYVRKEKLRAITEGRI